MNKILKLVNLKTLKAVLCSIPYIFFWWLILLMVSIGYSEGSFATFEYTFGEWFVLIGWFVAGIVALSIIYIRFWVKREWVVQTISYSATIIFLVIASVFLSISTSKFQKFTTEKWINCPECRMTMYFDLEENYNIKGYSTLEVEALFGKPDKITNDNTYIYDDRHGNIVYVMFENEKAMYFYYVE